MVKQIEFYDGNIIAKYIETEEKKQMLWDALILWCKENNAFAGECYQNDNFQLNAPDFIADAIDKIVMFETGSENECTKDQNFKTMSLTKREFIKTINVNEANFEYIAKNKTINGSLLLDIERVMQSYADQEIKAFVDKYEKKNE